MTTPVIVSAVRTAIGKQGGALATLPYYMFGAEVMREAVRRAEIQHHEIDDVIFGNCLSGGGNPARMTLLQAGIPFEVPGMTIDRQCGTGINAVALAADLIKAGRGSVYLTGGVESMSRSPYLLSPATRPYDRNPPQFIKRKLSPDDIGDPPMGITAENVAEKYKITREEQDEYAAESQRRMARAMKEGLFDKQIVPIEIRGKKETYVFKQDEHPRHSTTIESLSPLSPVFKEGGTVTAGNASGVNDGASALVMMSHDEAQKRHLTVLAAVVDSQVAGVDPNMMGMGPVPAVRKLLKRNQLSIKDIDFVELNEAFASQVLACNRELEIPKEKLNVNGGAIAHGHPIAATGGILITKAVYHMNKTRAKRAIVTACIGGGQGIAILLENTNEVK
ncbi:thiolase family protein [Fictibacillus sp. 7GRE50]|uniref:thiolase family protein n=1 Tax=Fictibacillus sp. 7GRE50 TaxID=2745878 RepID=UPI0018CF7472|nr:thiolase family protein [Fictibacillus sp. 7GRE50]MBH0166062.1 thiolase family protein [Fictibacillus sp. 7GRE50]